MSATIERGYKTELYWIEEVTEGTPPSGGTPPPTYNAEYVFLETRIARELITQPTVGGRDWAFIHRGVAEYTLPITFFPVNISLMQYAIANIDKTITIWTKYPTVNQNLVFSGAKPNALRLTGAFNTVTQAVMEFWPTKLTRVAPTANTQTLPTALPMHGKDGFIKIGGVTKPEFRAWSVEISNALERVGAPGSTEYRLVRERNRVVSGELTGTFESIEHLDSITNDTDFTLDIALGKDSGNTTRTLTITGCKFREHPIPVRKTDLIALRLPFTGKTPSLA